MIGVLALGALALPIMTGTGVAAGLSSTFDGTNGTLDTSPLVHSRPDPVGNQDTTTYNGASKENDVCAAVDTAGGTNPVPAKDDLDDFSLGVKNESGSVFMYVAWHRVAFSGNGSASIDFELNKSLSACNSAGNKVNPVRSDGDALITYFYGGGNKDVPIINTRTWSSALGKFVPDGGNQLDATSANASISGDQQFGEAVIDLTKAGFFTAGKCDNFASAYVKSRTGSASDSSFTSSNTEDFTERFVQPISNCGAVDILKTDDASPAAPVAGVTFDLFANVAGKPGGPALQSCTTQLDAGTPPSAVCQLKDILPGAATTTYWAVERAAPAGYAVAAPKSFTVDSSGNTTPAALTFVDARQAGAVKIVKTDDAAPPAPLAGATFGLFTDKNGAIGSAVSGKTCTTANDGTCTIGGILPAGTYWLHETTAPTGFASAADKQVVVTLGQTTTVALTDARLGSAITLVKTVNGNGSTTPADPQLAERGANLDYAVKVTNSGGLPLTVTSLSDTLKSDLPSSCTQGVGSTLAPGANFTCSYSSTAAVPANNELIVNTASVAAADQFGRSVQASDARQVRVLDPAIAIVKAAPTGGHVGDTAAFTLTVTNPGNTGLATVTVGDPKCDAAPVLGTKTGGNQDDVLDVGETWAYSCSRVVQTGDGTSLVNTATATGTDALGTKVDATSSTTTALLHPAIAIGKTPSPTSANPGQTVTYTYKVTNPGDTPLGTVTVTDDKCAPVQFKGGDTNGDARLDVNESWTYTCANAASANAGDQTNVGTATGTDPLGGKVTATASATISVVLAEVVTAAQVETPPAQTVTQPAAQPAPATEAQATTEQLPFTGADVVRMVVAASMLILLGVFLTLDGGKRLRWRRTR